LSARIDEQETGPAVGALTDRSVSVLRANLLMLLIAVPLVLALGAVYVAVWGAVSFITGVQGFLQWRVVIPTLVIGIPLHEVIHGLAWAGCGRRPIGDIHFGVQWKTLTPYAHLRVPVPAGAYRWGAAMPALILGLVPYLAGLAFGVGWLVCVGLFFVFAAGGDLLVLWLLRGVDPRAPTEDLPSRAGCTVHPLPPGPGDA
jgi:hypothetical protein